MFHSGCTCVEPKTSRKKCVSCEGTNVNAVSVEVKPRDQKKPMKPVKPVKPVNPMKARRGRKPASDIGAQGDMVKPKGLKIHIAKKNKIAAAAKKPKTKSIKAKAAMKKAAKLSVAKKAPLARAKAQKSTQFPDLAPQLRSWPLRWFLPGHNQDMLPQILDEPALEEEVDVEMVEDNIEPEGGVDINNNQINSRRGD